MHIKRTEAIENIAMGEKWKRKEGEEDRNRVMECVCGSYSGNGRSGGVGVVPNSRFSHHHPPHHPTHLHGHPHHNGQGALAFSNNHFHLRKASGLTVVPRWNFSVGSCRDRALQLWLPSPSSSHSPPFLNAGKDNDNTLSMKKKRLGTQQKGKKGTQQAGFSLGGEHKRMDGSTVQYFRLPQFLRFAKTIHLCILPWIPGSIEQHQDNFLE